MNRKAALSLTVVSIAFMFVFVNNSYCSDVIDGLISEEFEVTQWDGLPASPSVSPTNTARIFYDGSTDKLQLSVNGGAYSNLLTVLTDPSQVSDTAYAASWDTVTTIAPSKNAVYDKINSMSAGGDSITVNSTAVDTTANFLDGDILWTLTDGGAGGPDAITGTFAADTVHDTMIDWGSGANQVDLADIPGGISGANVWDFGGATSTEIVNGASLTLDAAGEVGVNSTHKGFAWYDGTQEVFSPSLHILQGTVDFAGFYDSGPAGHELWIMDLDAGTYPHGIYITAVSVDCSAADPTTELDANLSYCDAVAGAAFPGANVTVIKAIDTTTGNFADAAVNTAVASGKSIYIDIDADPTDANTVYHIKITYYIPES